MCNVTIASNSNNVRSALQDLGVIAFDGTNFTLFHRYTWVVVNGDIVGVTPDPKRIYSALIDMKRQGDITVHAAICWDHARREIRVSTESGRCVRPLYIINDGDRPAITRRHIVELWNDRISWMQLVSGCREKNLVPALEFLDVEEVDHLMLAMRFADLSSSVPRAPNLYPRRYTHLEVHPSLMFGVLTSCIPFSDHNQVIHGSQSE